MRRQNVFVVMGGLVGICAVLALAVALVMQARQEPSAEEVAAANRSEQAKDTPAWKAQRETDRTALLSAADTQPSKQNRELVKLVVDLIDADFRSSGQMLNYTIEDIQNVANGVNGLSKREESLDDVLWKVRYDRDNEPRGPWSMSVDTTVYSGPTVELFRREWDRMSQRIPTEVWQRGVKMIDVAQSYAEVDLTEQGEKQSLDNSQIAEKHYRHDGSSWSLDLESDVDGNHLELVCYSTPVRKLSSGVFRLMMVWQPPQSDHPK